MKYSEILKQNNLFSKEIKSEKYKIKVISNIIVHQIKDILEYYLRIDNINGNVQIGNYDNIINESYNVSEYKLIVIYWELANIVEGLQYKADLMNKNEIEALIDQVKNEIDIVYKNLKKNSLVIINTFSSLVFNQYNYEGNNFDMICSRLNNYLLENKNPNIFIVNIDKIISRLSIDSSIDFRYYYSSKSLYTVEFLKEYCKYIKPVILSANGRAKKALIFDCDNTLWKGILGEDGEDDVCYSSLHPNGSVFEEVQTLALNLSRKGIIIGLCSKNNLNDINLFFQNHFDITLKEKDILIKKINWNDKVTNLLEIATELNIGLDSMVFVDDSDFEINLIRKSLPDVQCIQVPKKQYQYPLKLRSKLGYFINLSKTKEDINKNKMYQEQIQRLKLKKSFNNLEDYLKTLELEITIFRNNKKMTPRISQMTLKTNQFNLTTKRYTETDVLNFIVRDDYEVFALSLKDKFGDNGITGLIIIKIVDKKAEIDTFLISCRIIGRNIEYAFFDYIIKYLKKRGIEIVLGQYIKTNKNNQVSDLYKKMGFVEKESCEKTTNYKLSICKYKQNNLSYMEILDG